MDYFDRSILKKKKKNNYTSISNGFLQDNSLSFEARGLGASLLSRPDDWEINVNALMAEGNIGRDKVRKIINELIQAGYMYRSKNRTSGKFAKSILFISDEKDYLFEEVVEKEIDTPSMENCGDFYGENTEINSLSVKNCGVQPQTEKPATVIPATENHGQQIQLNNKKKNITKTTTTEIDYKNNINLKNSETKQSSSSSYKYEFLKNYNISAGTKLNICRYITNLTEEKFAEIYSLTEKSFAAGEINSFEGVLYKALKGEWTFPNRSADVSNTIDKDKKFVKEQANHWLSYLDVGYSQKQVLNGFLNNVKGRDENIVNEYKNKILNYFKRGA
ncbi:hypothetical protein HUW86_09540 [Fusobacterium sp. SB021]|uniref:hypothetical protein n=1 Tax=Fusobacterium sp. SB021 TaxID=2744227 RepID=UPI003CF12EB6